MTGDLPTVGFATPGEFEAWLEENHAGSEGIWLKIAKKGSGVSSVTYAEALRACLCFGCCFCLPAAELLLLLLALPTRPSL